MGQQIKSQQGEQTRPAGPDWQAATPHPCGRVALVSAEALNRRGYWTGGVGKKASSTIAQQYCRRGEEVTVSEGRKAAARGRLQPGAVAWG